MKILITGGAGLIGQAIAKHHINIGDDVYIYDNRSNEYNDYSNIVGKDVSSLSLTKLLQEDFDVISHQAAFVGVGESQYKIEKYINNNIGFTAKLLQTILELSIKPRIIHAGSMGPYGNNQNPAHENNILTPMSYYAISKQTQEQMIELFTQTYGLTGISLRYFSVYGSNCSPNNPYTGVLSIIANKIINSNIIDLNEDGFQTRDLIHVDDVADAHYLASRKEFNGFEKINIATGESVTLKYVTERMVEILSPEKRIIFNGKYRRGDLRNSNASVEKAKIFLSWKSKISINEGIDLYCKFIKDNIQKFNKNDSCAEEDKNLNKFNLFEDTKCQ